ncbi:DUF3616 domain-containing protein [Methylobacterium nonmethylotrophicum]|uniref:DUF3616 domain-containing protein n=1 Tax=Methylobacterium nonmethylotrophicum TaxID=1141884 RepID=UPI001436C6C8|nr:DUF3616 domain-containing protein [Methylobacterium nonmethylotrophicum]
MTVDQSWPGEPWPVIGKLLGEEQPDGRIDKSQNVSGIASTQLEGAVRYGLVIDDESQATQLVMVERQHLKVGATIRLIDDVNKKGHPLELDGEGVAYADGHFYVVGSHGHPRDKEKRLDPGRDAEIIRRRTVASSRLVRIALTEADIKAGFGQEQLDATFAQTGRLRTVLSREPLLAPFLSRPLDENGLTIEGLVARHDRLYVGLRAPSLGGDAAAVLSVKAAAIFTDTDEVAPELHLLRLGPGRGVRDLAASPWGALVLAGPSGEVPGPYSIYHWDYGATLELVGEIPSVPGKAPRKPEALLYLTSEASSAWVLVLFDGGKEGEPRPLRIRLPSGLAAVGG